jgi:hypothetical protein
MSRRCHHGTARHARAMGREVRRPPATIERPPSSLAGHADPGVELEEPGMERLPEAAIEPEVRSMPPSAIPTDVPAPRAGLVGGTMAMSMAASTYRPAIATQAALPMPAPSPIRAREPGDVDAAPADGVDHGATAPQLRRFIKSRAYVPMHELRRRFGINGDDDDVTPVDVDRQRVYVGLPPREGSLLGELLRAGDIGFELSLDPIAPIVVGVYPMRPVPRS